LVSKIHIIMYAKRQKRGGQRKKKVKVKTFCACPNFMS